MKYGSDQVAFFLISGLDVVGCLTEFEDKREARTEETHTLGDSWVEHTAVGARQSEITQSGFYDDAAGSIHDALSSGPGATSVLCFGLEGTATGAAFSGYSQGVQVDYQRQAERDALTKAKATYRAAGPVEEGKVLVSWSKPGSTGIKGKVDLGASSTGLSAYLQWAAASGEANIRIMNSASGGTSWQELMVFTKTVKGSHGAERLTTTGDVKRYVALDITTASATGKIAALNVMAGVVPKHIADTT